MEKRTYTVTYTSTSRIVVEKPKDDADGERKALQLAKLFLEFDDENSEEKKDMVSTKRGLGLDSGTARGHAVGFEEEFSVEEDEDSVEESEHEEAGDGVNLGELEEPEDE